MRKVMHHQKYILGIVGAFLLALVATLFLPGTATAAKDVENTYAIVVTTGNLSGADVTYFGLEYVATDGYSHIEYIFPHKGGLKDSILLASDGNYSTSEAALDRGKTNTFLFRPAYEVVEIVGLDVYCQGDQGSLYAWEVSGLRLYRVDQFIDVVSNGQSSTIRFNGSQLATLQERNGNGGVTFSWTGDTLFRLRDDPNATYRLIFETIPYSMDSSFEYLVRLDLADVSGAGFEHMNQAYNSKKILREANFGEYLAIQIEYMDTFGDARTMTQGVMTSTVEWLMKNGVSGDTPVAAVAQQGESIVFGCNLQDMQTVKAVTLHTGAEAAALLNCRIAGTESASFTGISIYPAGSVSVDVSSEENIASAPQYFFAGSPLFYHTANSIEGETVPADGTHYISMRPYEDGAVLAPATTTERYLITLIADPSQILLTPSDVLIELSYVDMSGTERTSGTYSVRSGSKDYYGYWPASVDDFDYTGLINSTDGICVVMELPEVEHFTGLTVSVPGGSSDWQMDGFSVIRLDSLSRRICRWEDVISQGGMSNRRYFRNAEGYMVFSMEEKALIQANSGYQIDFISQSVQPVEDFDWSQYRYAMSYDQCSSNLGLAKVRENYTVEVQVQSGTTSLLDGYGDNGSKNRFYFMLEFENGVSGYVLANQQLSADGFRSGATESFTVSTNYDYGELLAVHIIPDDISEDSDPYDKLNIAQIRVRRNDDASVSKEWIVQNVGWVGIDYRDEGANNSITGQQGRTESDIARVYPISYSSYALNLEFRIGTGTYAEESGVFYGTMEATLEYYNRDGKRNQLTFDVIRAMYDYANRAPIYLDSGIGSSGTPLAVTDNSFMFRENHTDRFVISVSDVARLGKLSLNIKSFNGGTLQITNVSAAMVLESGLLQINEQDEYMRTGETEYLCEDSVEKIPAFELYLPTDRNIYQEIYFSDHEPIKLDAENSTWISTVSRVPNSQNDLLNIFVYPAEDAFGQYDIGVRAQYTNHNGVVLETGATKLNKLTDAEGRTVYSINGLKATGMSTLNKIFVKTQSAGTVDAYIDHVIIQQVRSGVVINTFYADCEHRNANNEFYAVTHSIHDSGAYEQKIWIALGDETEAANLVSENRDIAVALQYTTTSGGGQTLTSRYIYITDQQYQSIKAGDIIELTFHENYVQDITGILVATSGNIKAQIEMVCADTFSVTEESRQHLKHFSIPTGAIVKNQMISMAVNNEIAVEILEMEFVTAQSDAYLESGTTDPIAMVLAYINHEGVLKEVVLPDIRDYVISEGEAFSTGSTTRIRMIFRDIASVQSIRLMPYNDDPLSTAVWKPSQITVSLGVDGSGQRSTRAVEEYIQEDRQIDPEQELKPEMVGGAKISLANIILAADVAATNESGYYGNSYRVSSAGNKTVSLTVSSGATVKVRITLSNSELGYHISAEQTNGVRDISGQIIRISGGFELPMPKNTTGQDQTYQITIGSMENENISIEILITVKSAAVSQPEEPTEPSETEEPTEPSESEEPTEPSEPEEPTEPSEPEEPTEPSESEEPTEPSDSEEPTEPSESEEPAEST